MSGSTYCIFIVVNKLLDGGKRLENKSPRAESSFFQQRKEMDVWWNLPQKRGMKKKQPPLVLKINFKDTKQVVCSAVSFRRKPKAEYRWKGEK